MLLLDILGFKYNAGQFCLRAISAQFRTIQEQLRATEFRLETQIEMNDHNKEKKHTKSCCSGEILTLQ